MRKSGRIISKECLFSISIALLSLVLCMPAVSSARSFSTCDILDRDSAEQILGAAVYEPSDAEKGHAAAAMQGAEMKAGSDDGPDEHYSCVYFAKSNDDMVIFSFAPFSKKGQEVEWQKLSSGSEAELQSKGIERFVRSGSVVLFQQDKVAGFSYLLWADKTGTYSLSLTIKSRQNPDVARLKFSGRGLIDKVVNFPD